MGRTARLLTKFPQPHTPSTDDYLAGHEERDKGLRHGVKVRGTGVLIVLVRAIRRALAVHVVFVETQGRARTLILFRLFYVVRKALRLVYLMVVFLLFGFVQRKA